MARIVILLLTISNALAQPIEGECFKFKTNLETHKNLILCRYQGFWVSKKCVINGCVNRLPPQASWSVRYQTGMQAHPGGLPNPNAIACEAAGGLVELVELQRPKHRETMKRSLCLIHPNEWVESDLVLNIYQK